MSYAVKIGEIELRSDKPITDEQRFEAVHNFMEKPLIAEKRRGADGVILTVKLLD